MRGVEGIDEIRVEATIYVPARNDARAQERIDSDMVLSLEQDSDVAELKAWFENGVFGWGDSPSISLVVEMPVSMHLRIDDGSGSMEVENVRGDVYVDDGSGSLRLENVGGFVEVDDGSGSITIIGVGGDLSINDGSGGIDVRGVAGSVTVDDGSGGIDVRDVERDFTVVDDGSGGVDYSNIGGDVDIDS